MTRPTSALLLAAALVALGGCGTGAGPGTPPQGACGPLRVVVTTTVLGAVVSGVVGDLGEVEVLMPVGADPHEFQASAREAAAVRGADLLVANGLGLEGGLSAVLASAAARGTPVVEAASFVEVLPWGSGAGASPAADPHIWTDPRRMAEVATGIGEALAAADPACSEEWRAAAATQRQALLDLDAEIEGILAAVPAERRRLVTNHAAFGYFADRYGFTVVGVIIPGGSTLAEPSPADLAGLVEVMRREGVRAVFAETTQPTGLADALAAELGPGVAVASLYTESLGPPGSGADTYAGMLRTDAERIAAALGGP
jgi:zinc/manganese transport system substrate-binding protein